LGIIVYSLVDSFVLRVLCFGTQKKLFFVWRVTSGYCYGTFFKGFKAGKERQGGDSKALIKLKKKIS